ncbi:MAG: hypothetical protein J0I41_07915 [Filimonas sp.]|nr:hypothetical protein [Filimonas sp.]
MNHELWNKILVFDFDNPPAEYSFSIRLADENAWTKQFTAQAILEYKKFMYLAATSDFMVSPSEIVDTVWHQHLIFTQSYQDFCSTIGKQIQHVPSTHNKEDFQKFKQAKERTTKLYAEAFGEQPRQIWEYGHIYEGLHLAKAKMKIRGFVVIGLLLFAALIIPCYYLLRPIYIHIDNPDFIISFIVIVILLFTSLEIYNRHILKKIVKQFDKDSFINHLTALELIYLQKGKLTDAINAPVNELIELGAIQINEDKTISLVSNFTNSEEQLQVSATLNDLGTVFYPTLLQQLATKPIFSNIAKSMNAFSKYFIKSKKFGQLFYLNFSACTILFLLGLTRYMIGISREKPVVQIGVALTILAIIIIAYLNRLTGLVSINTIPQLYKLEILPSRLVMHDWQWNYFLSGSSVLAASFIPLVNYVDRNSENNTGSCSSSCGSSCGSSCSSCGGCGGGD